MSVTARRVHLAARPVGLPDDSTWSVRDEPLADPMDGEVLVKVTHLSLDPAMRGWLNDVRSYVPPVGIDEVMRAFGAGTVLDFTPPRLHAGRRRHGHPRRHRPRRRARGSAGEDRPGRGPDADLAGRPRDAGDDSLVRPVRRRQGTAGRRRPRVGSRRRSRQHRGVRAAAPDGIDVYFDNVGGEVLDSALRVLRRGARIAICGAISSYNATEPPPGPAHYMSLLVNRASMTGFLVFDFEDRYAEAVEDILGRLADGSLVAREHVIEGGVDAFGDTLLMLFSGANTGKLVLQV